MTPTNPSDRVTIREARHYLAVTHGIRMSRPTFWRHFLPPDGTGISRWNATLERRGPAAAYTFALRDVERMAVAYVASKALGAAGKPLTNADSPRHRLRGRTQNSVRRSDDAEITQRTEVTPAPEERS